MKRCSQATLGFSSFISGCGIAQQPDSTAVHRHRWPQTLQPYCHRHSYNLGRLSCLGSSAFVLDGLRDALVGVSQQTRSRLVERVQFNELKSSYRKTPGPPSFGGSEEIVVRIADCVLFAHPGKAFACTICLSQSPRQVSNLRAVSIQEWSSGTDFRLPAT